ncbi:MAG: hypothetical protein JEY99_21040 [Spirochaetales bacterium]|nr:hypothetical protein [Spirochaetales bacterium]
MMVRKGVFFSLILLLLGVLAVFSCKNNLMDILEAPEISVLFDGEKISKTDSIRLENLPLGGTLECTITITNKGRTSKLVFPETDALELTGSNTDQFSISALEDRELNPGESLTLTLTFSPVGSTGEKQAEIIIKSNDGNESAFSFTVIGPAVASDSDLISPTVLLASEIPSITNAAPIPVTMTFNEPVVGFSTSMLTVTNANAENLITEDNIIFTFNLTNPSSEGVISVYLPSGKVPDIAGNLNAASTLLSFNYDSTSPEVSIESDNGSPTNIHPIPITITFSEEVSGFDESDIVISPIGASINNFDDSANPIFTAEINTGETAMDVTLNISSDAGTDTAGNGSYALSTPITISYDDSIPTVEISSSAAPNTSLITIPLIFTFSEEMVSSTFIIDDITVSSGTIENINTSDNITFTADLYNPTEGVVSVYLPSNKVLISSGTGNNASNHFTFICDRTAPTVLIQASDYVGTAIFPITVIFSEEVTGFDESDIDIADDSGTYSASVSSFESSNNIRYNIEITATGGPLEITIDIPAGAAADLTSNDSSALATETVVGFNDDYPTTTISSENGHYVKVNPIPIEITFSEQMDNFEVGDITPLNCSISNFQTTADPTIYTVDVTFPENPSVSSIEIASGIATASTGDPRSNAGSGIFDLTYDATIPTGTMVIDDENGYTNLTTVNLTLTADGTGTEDPEMMISNGSGFSGADWETFTETVTDWVIDDAGTWDVETEPTPVVRTIYYKLKDKAGNVSEIVSKTITQTPYGVIGVSVFGGAVFQ